jgi:rod shape-determining protein MreC
MPLGTLDRSPPPFFRQGPSALTRVFIFSALALLMMVADARFKLALPLRAAAATVLYPIERVLNAPLSAWGGASDYFSGLQAAQTAEARARVALTEQALRATHVDLLQIENNRLRSLLQLRPALTVRSLASEVLYDAPDPYSRKVIIDRGGQHGVLLASPVINEAGVLGQVTRVYPYSSEVTLLTDKEAAIPVLNSRTQARSAAFGNSNGAGLELRFMAGNADVQVGDLLSTSGVDGIYPPGVPVAKVVSVDRRVDSGFARIALTPLAQPDSVRHVLVLEPVGVQMPPKPSPEPEPEKATRPKKGARK